MRQFPAPTGLGSGILKLFPEMPMPTGFADDATCCTSVGVPGVGCPCVTVNATPLLGMPPTVTTTLPVVAPDGTATPMLVDDHDVGVAAVPLNVTVLPPWLVPKLLPEI